MFYSSSASSGGMFAGYDSPGVPGPLAVPAANRMVGERNENSVLFSLATLQNLAMGSPEMGQGAVAVAPSTSSTSSSSGLIDIRSLADAEPGAAAEPIGGAIPAPAPPPLAPAMMVPVMPRRSAPIGLIVGLASAGVVVVALSIVLTILLLHQPPSPAPGVVIPGAVAGVEKPGQQPASAASGAQVAIAPSAAKSSEPGAGGATGGPAEGTGSAQAEGEQLASPSGRPRPAGAAPAAPSSAAGAAAARPRPAAAAPAPAPRPAAAVAVAPAPPPAARTAPVAAAPAAPRKGSTSEVDDLLSRIEPAPAPAAAAPPRPAPAPAPAPAAAAAPAAGQQKSLEREDIAAVVRANKGKVQSCYERQAEPKLSGTLMVSFVIQRSGQVSSAAIRTPTFEGTPVGQCVLSAVRSFVFPAHTDPPVKINYPFILR
ncbi:MAG: AgmX/PglI C-terminal domain-containing protein [Deltaproteobacteria bacterium]|nr:AgmX/PglI C-terminal domain-containing protein [Deltaproteobacteria bacterium]